MSFPWHNPPWAEVASLLAEGVADGDRVLAPDQFWSILTRVDRYVPQNLVAGIEYDWVVLRTDDIGQIPRQFLEAVGTTLTAVFANRVFVVWRRHAEQPPNPSLRDTMATFWARLATAGPEPSEPNRCERDAALGDTPRIIRLAEVDDVELRASMNDLFGRTGYRYPTLRDQIYRNEMDEHVRAFVARHDDGRLLDLAAGSRPFVEVSSRSSVVRAELAEVGIMQARHADASQPTLTHSVMDAHRLAVASRAFDAVTFIDAIEHVRDAAGVFSECARVLRPGGELLLTFANRNSINQLLTEKLGYPRFLTNFQHIREFALDEVHQLLADTGFEVVETAGVSLYPYWGVPRVDAATRAVTDEDVEFVEIMSELGRRAGAEYAYSGVVRAVIR